MRSFRWAVAALAFVVALLTFTKAPNAEQEQGSKCVEVLYLNHGAKYWHFQFLAAKRGWRKADAVGQKHPKRFRSYTCNPSGHIRYAGHGPEWWHFRLVQLSQRAMARERIARRKLELERRIVRLAHRYIGTPYVWGGTTPGGFDCSGLVRYVYSRVGVHLARTTYAQYQEGRRVYRLRPGDVVFFYASYQGPEHEGIYIGHGQFIDAPHTGARVGVRTLSSYHSYVGARRFVTY